MLNKLFKIFKKEKPKQNKTNDYNLFKQLVNNISEINISKGMFDIIITPLHKNIIEHVLALEYLVNQDYEDYINRLELPKINKQERVLIDYLKDDNGFIILDYNDKLKEIVINTFKLIELRDIIKDSDENHKYFNYRILDLYITNTVELLGQLKIIR